MEGFCLRWSVLLILTLFTAPSWQDVNIELKKGSISLGENYQYTDYSYFSHRFANIPNGGKVTGYVWKWQQFQLPVNGCEYIPPIPSSASGSKDVLWFALIESPNSECPESMINNVRNAGFYLVLGYTNGSSSASDLSKSLIKSNFRVVSISGDYAINTLWNVAATNTVTADDDATSVTIEVRNDDAWFVSLPLSISFLALSFFILSYLTIYYYRKSRERRGLYQIRPATARDPLLQERYNQARIARQELIENILRQLQALQAENPRHPPLGEAATLTLPQRTYADLSRDFSSKETCAICVEEFQEDDVTRILPCSHFFHPACIDPWLTDHSSMCPLCKQPVSAPQGDARDNPVLIREDDSFESLSSTSTDSASAEEEFGTPNASTPAIAMMTSASPPDQMRGSSVNGESSGSLLSDTPLLHRSRPHERH